MNNPLQTLIHTPVWVYILFAVLIALGIRAMKPRVVPLRKIFLLPIVFLVLSVHTLVTSFHITTSTVLIWIGALSLGALLGGMLTANLKFNVDREHALIQLPGTWITVFMILLIFITKYYFGYELATDPALAHQHEFEFSMLAVSGATTGLFVGRLICYLHRFKKAKSVDLSGK